MKSIRKFYARWFQTLTKEEARDLGLIFHSNVYGDAINRYNCRSIWTDEQGRFYRVQYLVKSGSKVP